MGKLETTQTDKAHVAWLIHKYKLSQAQSSLQDNLEDYWIFLLSLSPFYYPFVIDYPDITPIFCLLLPRNYWGINR